MPLSPGFPFDAPSKKREGIEGFRIKGFFFSVGERDNFI